MKNLKITGMLAALLFLSVAGMQAQTVTPSKKYITREIKNVSNFSSIKVLGSADVEYRQSKDAKVKVSIYGSDNLVDLLEVSTMNGVLQVKVKEGVTILHGERRLKVVASSSSLTRVDIQGSSDVYLKGTVTGTGLQLNVNSSGDINAENLQYATISTVVKGSGDIKLKNIKATDIKAEVNGSGDIDMDGSAQRATLAVNGSGDISADKLITTNVIATVTGAGDIDCYASKQLDAKVVGSGEIEYKGNPSVVNRLGKKEQIVRK